MILDTRTVEQQLVIRGTEPNRTVWWGELCICNETDDYQRVGRFAIAAGPLTGKSIAWIGGGFCVGPRAFAVADCTQTVYEREPSFARFCPDEITFVPGDWTATMIGTFDLIIWDVGGPIPAALSEHLADSGKVVTID